MKRNFVMSSLMLLLFCTIWGIVYFQFPFYKQGLVVIGISILIMTIIHERYVFLYGITVVISYGVFLTIKAFVNDQSTDVQILYIYDHLLLTSCILLFWVLITIIKNIGYENENLQMKINTLEKNIKQTGLLTMNEFLEQAKLIHKASERREEESWFIEISLKPVKKRIKQNLLEYVSVIVLDSIRADFDIVTTDNMQKVYILLQSTDLSGVDVVIDRIKRSTKNRLNYVEPPYEIDRESCKGMESLVAKGIGG